MFYMPDDLGDAAFGNVADSNRYVFVIGGDAEPFTAGVVLQRDRGVEPLIP